MAALDRKAETELDRYFAYLIGSAPTDADRQRFATVFHDDPGALDVLRKMNASLDAIKRAKEGSPEAKKAGEENAAIVKEAHAHKKLADAIHQTKVAHQKPAAAPPAPPAKPPEHQHPADHAAHPDRAQAVSGHVKEFKAHQSPEAVRVDYDKLSAEQKAALKKDEKDLATGFDVNAYALTPEQEKQIEAQKANLDTITQGGHKIRLNGCASTTGSQDYNRELGLARAEAVRQKLIGMGYKEDQIEVTAGGSEDLEKQTPPGTEEALNRRVTVSAGSDIKPEVKPAPDAAVRSTEQPPAAAKPAGTPPMDAPRPVVHGGPPPEGCNDLPFHLYPQGGCHRGWYGGIRYDGGEHHHQRWEGGNRHWEGGDHRPPSLPFAGSYVVDHGDRDHRSENRYTPPAPPPADLTRNDANPGVTYNYRQGGGHVTGRGGMGMGGRRH